MKLRPVGAHFKPLTRSTEFTVWAPFHDRVDVLLENRGELPMRKIDLGYFFLEVDGCLPGSRYRFRTDDRVFADPASRSQPEGVHGPSEVFAEAFPWTDTAWRGPDLRDLVFYELHTGAFSASGDFAGLGRQLGHLNELGVTALEIMPVSQFPGTRNWGYDGVLPFAVQNSYGGPRALKELVDLCHRQGLAVFLDVVYNHFGPEGNYLAKFGPYYHDKYQTPWGQALNFDGAHNDGLRNYFLCNARQWLEEFHLDGLRLDAVHAICDLSAKPFLEELAELKDRLQKNLGRKLHLIAETDSNDARLLRRRGHGGTGLDGHWNDDLHHSVHTLLTGEKRGYYGDFGRLAHLARVYERGVCYDGVYSPFHRRRRGRSYRGVERGRLVVCTQNHDQVGNRCFGERLSMLVGPEALKLAAACIFLSPFLPLIFMGEECAARRPFLYFVDHQDRALLAAVRRGRKNEFADFVWEKDPPDPAAERTFLDSRIDLPALKKQNPDFFALYKTLIGHSKWLRRHRIFEPPALHVAVDEAAGWLRLAGAGEGFHAEAVFNFSPAAGEFPRPAAPLSPDPVLAEGFSQNGNGFLLQKHGFAFFRDEPPGGTP